MSSFLDKIRQLTLARVEADKKKGLPRESGHEPADALQRFKAARGPRIIAEVKRKSPSRGQIAMDLDPVAIAKGYDRAGATMISVLTEPEYFGGSLETLGNIRAVLPKSLLLMKDFVLDPFQIQQGRALGADCVLLIHAFLGEAKLAELHTHARELGLTPLVEVHDEKELASAQEIGATLIGVNNRDLHSLQTDLEVSRRLAKLRKPDIVFVSESGIESRKEIDSLSSIGFDAFLIGTALTKEGHPEGALRKLLGAP